MANDIVPQRGKSIFDLGAEGRSIISEIFDGHPVRGIIVDGRHKFYAKDVGEAAGLSRQHTQKVVNRISLTHPEKVSVSTLGTLNIGGPNNTNRVAQLLDQDVISVFFNEIELHQLREDRKEKVIRFRGWFDQLITGIFTGETERATLQHIQEYMDDNDWKEIRSYTKQSNKVLMATLQETMEGKYGVGKVPRHIFMNENRMNNKFACGKHEKGIRDKMTSHELGVLYMSEHADTAYLLDGCTDYQERKLKLERVAAQYHKVLGGKTPKHLIGEQSSLSSYGNT